MFESSAKGDLEFEREVQGWEGRGWVTEVKRERLEGVGVGAGSRWWEGKGGLARGLVDGLVDEIRELGHGRVEMIFDAAVAHPTPTSLSSPTLTFVHPTAQLCALPAPALLILTAPSPQTSILLPTPSPATTEYTRTFALLLPTLSLPSLPVYHRNPHPALTSLSTGTSPALPSIGICLQSTPSLLSLSYDSASDAEIRAAFFAVLRSSALVPAETVDRAQGLGGRESQVKRWKFAQVGRAQDEGAEGADDDKRVVVLDGGRVVLAGDGTAGGRGGVEGAWRAGMRAAEVVRDWIDKHANAGRGNL